MLYLGFIQIDKITTKLEINPFTVPHFFHFWLVSAERHPQPMEADHITHNTY